MQPPDDKTLHQILAGLLAISIMFVFCLIELTK
jgi:hypothetical protein